MTEYRILGTTDDVTDCEREGCPKTGLRMTYHLAVIGDGGDVEGEVYYGSECAAMVTGIPAAKIRQRARAANAERRNREYRARLILDTYACLAHALEDDGDRRARRELIERYWLFHPALYRSINAGFAENISAKDEIAKDLAEARKTLPDYEPDMRLHNPQTHYTGNGWSWSCKCARRHRGRPYALRSEAERAITDDHDVAVAEGIRR